MLTVVIAAVVAFLADRFSKILENITKHPNLFELKQNDSKLRIFAKNIDSISKAHETLSKLLN